MVGDGCRYLGLIASFLIASSPQQKGDQDPALDRYYTANALYNRGLYELAADEFSAFLKKNPKHARAKDARYGLALSFYGMGKHRQAEPILSKLAADGKFPHRVRACTIRGHALLGLGREEEAERTFGRSVGKAGNDDERRDALVGLVEAQYRRGRWKELIQSGSRLLKLGKVAVDRLSYQIAEARFELGKHAEAAAALEAWLKAHPKSPFLSHALFLRAECRLQTDDLRRAGREFQDIARRENGPFAATALFRLGYVRFLERRHDDAVRELSNFIRKYPKDSSVSQARLFLGRAHLEKGRLENAAAELTKAAGDSSVAAEAALWLARTRGGQGRHADAEKAIAPHLKQFAGKKSPFAAELYGELGRARLEQGKFAAAADASAKAVGADPEGPEGADLRWLCAHALHRAGRYADSLGWCDGFLKRHADHPRSGDVAFLRAENLFLAGKFAAAGSAYASFLKERPKHAQVDAARFRSGQVAYRGGDWKGALVRLDPLLKRTPKGPLFEPIWFIVGECRFNQGAWDAAVDAYRKFVSRAGKAANADTAHLRMARAYVRKGEASPALKTLEALVRRYPGSPHRAVAYAELGRLAYQGKDYARARSALGQAIKAGEDLEAPYYLGWVALAEKKEDEACRHFRQVAEKHPKQVLAADAALQFATLKVRRGEYAEARVALERALADHPKFTKADRALAALGLSLARLKEWEAAIKRFASLIRNYPKSASAPQALYEWAWCEREAGRNGEARKRYGEFLERHPRARLAADVTVELAELEFEAEEIDAAADRLEKLVASGLRKALRPRVLYRLGRCHASRGDLKEAARTFEALLKVDPESGFAGRAAFQAGEARLKLKEYEAAVGHFRRAAGSGSGIGERGLLRRGECEALTGRWKESEASCAEFLKRYPESALAPRARFGRGWAQENQGKREEAVAEYRKVLAARGRDETSARSQFQIGECLFALKRYDEAIKELIKVEVSYGYPQWRSRALLEIGRVLEAQKKKGDAAARYREVLRKYGDLEAAAVARQLLDKMSSKRGDP